VAIPADKAPSRYSDFAAFLRTPQPENRQKWWRSQKGQRHIKNDNSRKRYVKRGGSHDEQASMAVRWCTPVGKTGIPLPAVQSKKSEESLATPSDSPNSEKDSAMVLK